MIRIFMAVFLICSTLAAYQEETQKTPEPQKPETEKPQTDPASKSTSPSGKSSSSKEPGKKNGTSNKQSSAPASASPQLSPAAQAATDAIAALSSAIHLSSTGDKHLNEQAAAKLAELRGQLDSGDPNSVAREAAKWTAQIYQVGPLPVQTEKAPDVQPARPARSIDPIWILLLVSLTSPLICIGGFWFGSRIADEHLRKNLREAGLL